jgi:hypothetical protein
MKIMFTCLCSETATNVLVSIHAYLYNVIDLLTLQLVNVYIV